MPREAFLALMITFAALAGCLQAPVGDALAQGAVASGDPAPTPARWQLPNGSAWGVSWFNVTEDDWTQDAQGRWTLIVSSEVEGGDEWTVVSLYAVREDTLTSFAGHSGTGNGCAWFTLVDSSPTAFSLLVVSATSGMASSLRHEMTVWKGTPECDFRVEGETAPPFAQGTDPRLSVYWDWPFLPLVDSPLVLDVEVEDERIGGGTGASAAGTLRLTADHDFGRPGLHERMLLLMGTAELATWSATSTLDGEDTRHEGLVVATAAGGVPAYSYLDAGFKDSARTVAELEEVMGVLPHLIFLASSVPFDPATLGLKVERNVGQLQPLNVLRVDGACHALVDGGLHALPTCGALLERT